MNSITQRIQYEIKRRHIFMHLLDRVKWYVYPKIGIVPRFPTHLDIEISSACQLSCPMCPTGNSTMSMKKKGVMSYEAFTSIIDEAKKYNVYSIKLSWRGEPKLNKSLWEMVRYAKENGILDVSLLTNGEAMTDEDLDNMISSGLDWISFSIDGMAETYNKIRKPSTFIDITNKLCKLKTKKELAGTLKPLVRVQSIYSAISDNPDEYFDYWNKIVDKVGYIMDQDRASNIRNFPRDNNYVCSSPWQRMVIGYNGRVYPCVSDYLERNCIGDIRQNSLYDIWHGKEIKKFRKLHKNKLAISTHPSCMDCCHAGKMISKEIMINGKLSKISIYDNQTDNEQI